MKKKLLLVTMLALLLAGIFIQCGFNSDSLNKIEAEARKTQNIAESAKLYYDILETSASNEKVKLTLLLFEEENKFTYSLYRNSDFVEGGAAMIDEYNAVSLQASVVKNAVVLFFYGGGFSADKVLFLDCEGNSLDKIEVGENACVKILKEKGLKNAEYYQLMKGNEVILRKNIVNSDLL